MKRGCGIDQHADAADAKFRKRKAGVAHSVVIMKKPSARPILAFKVRFSSSPEYFAMGNDHGSEDFGSEDFDDPRAFPPQIMPNGGGGDLEYQ